MTSSLKTNAPTRLGPYEVLVPIARGGMGTVMLARSMGPGGFERRVAVKVMHDHLRESDEFSDDLIEEAKLAAHISHPNVVRVIDAGEEPAGVYLVMEYVEGDSLSGLIRAMDSEGEPFPTSIGLRILHDGLTGLHAAHELCVDGAPVNLVHRDFTPQNILVGLDGHSRLTDFGVAKAASRSSHTTTGAIKGKLRFMPLEQARADPIDRRADVWAAGIIAWEIIAGRRVYEVDNDAAILVALLEGPPPPLSSVCPEVSPALEAAVTKALAHEPADRFATAAAFAEALADAARADRCFASHVEVSAMVARLRGAKLQQRREQVMAVIEQRAADEHDDEVPTSEVSDPPSSTFEGAVKQAGQAGAASRWPRAATIALAAALLAVGGVVALRTTGHAEQLRQQAVPSPIAVVAAAPAPVAPAEQPAAPAPEPALPLRVTANASLSSLTLDGERVALEPVAGGWTVARPEGEGDIDWQAISADGRVTRGTAKRDADSIAISFVLRMPGASPAVAKPAAPQGELAPNPFD